MKNKLTFTLLFITMNFIFSQQKVKSNNGKETIKSNNIENGKVENGIYSCNRLKWKIKIPKNYFIIDEKELGKLEENGNKIAKKNLPKNINIQNRTHLIGFKLNDKNTFTASFNPLEKTKKVTLEEHKNFLTELLKKSCEKFENAKFDIKSSNVKIGNYQFYKIKLEGYSKSNNQLVISQIYYNSFIQKHLFGVLITYNNEIEGKLIESNFLNSLNK